MISQSLADFHSLEPSDQPGGDVAELTSSLLLYGPTDAIAGKTLMWDSDIDLINETLSNLTPQNAVAALATKDFNNPRNVTDPFYGVEHTVEILKVNNMDNVDFEAPPKLKFTPAKLQLTPPETTKYPKRILKSKGLEVWWKVRSSDGFRLLILSSAAKWFQFRVEGSFGDPHPSSMGAD
eukprot:GHVN01019340.1.p3 GENE.GHVN01019340.1~~GHVN01019340.1.p3  ORF type:complete len:180 (+),score=24.19 GHVN01019340.1:1538-2077(+)